MMASINIGEGCVLIDKVDGSIRWSEGGGPTVTNWSQLWE